jgi:WD40 repeat protein
LAWSLEGELLASGSLDGTVRIWDTAIMEELTVLDNLGSIDDLAWSTDGRQLAIGNDEDVLMIWDVSKIHE